MNVNDFLFTRTQPTKKLETIKAMTDREIATTSKDTLLRIVKEVGSKCYKSRDKELYISRDRRKGNDWNSVVEGLFVSKGVPYINCYIQYGECDTDTNQYIELRKFYAGNEYRGSIEGSDRRGNPRTYYYTYDALDRIKVLRSILLEYIYRKYEDKLKAAA